MNNASQQMTPCEYIRMANDLAQGDNDRDNLIRKYLANAELLAKNLSLELDKYDKKYWHRFEVNKDFESDLLFRKHEKYKFVKL